MLCLSQAGTLPSFSWVAPSAQGSDHPCNDIRKGERQLKDIYEAIRAGPKWKRTLMLVVYDDYGGAYDHVVPPAEWRTCPPPSALNSSLTWLF